MFFYYYIFFFFSRIFSFKFMASLVLGYSKKRNGKFKK